MSSCRTTTLWLFHLYMTSVPKNHCKVKRFVLILQMLINLIRFVLDIKVTNLIYICVKNKKKENGVAYFYKKLHKLIWLPPAPLSMSRTAIGFISLWLSWQTRTATRAGGSSRQDFCRDNPDDTPRLYRSSARAFSLLLMADCGSSVPRQTPSR